MDIHTHICIYYICSCMQLQLGAYQVAAEKITNEINQSINIDFVVAR